MNTLKKINAVEKDEFNLVDDNNIWLIRITICIFFLIINICVFTAQSLNQPQKISIGAELLSSGNGHGAFYSPYLSLNSGSHSFLVGAMIHKRSGLANGCKLTYSKNLSGQRFNVENEGNQTLELLQLNFFSYLQYTDKMPLCRSVVRTEQSIRRENSVNWSEVNYSTAELGGGIELRINLTKYLSIRNVIGAGVYNHLTYIKGMDHEKIAPTLNLSTGLQINLN